MNDTQHEMKIYWHVNGQKCYEGMRRDGEKHGVDTIWDERGQKEYEVYYVHGEEYAKIIRNREGAVTSVKSPPRKQPTNQTEKKKEKRKKKKSYQGINKLIYA